jgi:hypothetical protein
MNTTTAAATTTTEIARMAEILAGATVKMARDENMSLPAAYALVRRAFAAKWPHLASIVPLTLSQLIGHDAAVALAKATR